MSKEKIDLKSIKKLNVSGKPVKKGVSKSNSNNWKYKGVGKAQGGVKKNSGLKSSNKGKVKSAKEQKPQVKKEAPEEWLYLSEDVDGLLRLKNTCMNVYGMDTQYWEELGVIEVISKENGNSEYEFSMDVEELEKDCFDEELEKYYAKNNIHFVAAVTIRCKDYETARQTLKKIQDNAGGFFCLDSANAFSN